MLIQITGVYISVVYDDVLVSVYVGYLNGDKPLFQSPTLFNLFYTEISLKTNGVIQCTMSHVNAAWQSVPAGLF